ncbi:MAG: hypothetical protein OEL66_08525, partial [Desulfobulbaceae bacterium]|nr:hypothetical protein [Desulfobulbaceae bacterium]
LIPSNHEKKHIQAKITALRSENGTIQEFTCIGRALTTANPTKEQVLGQRCQTVVSELTAGVAHEISDLSNGIINYAQLLADNDSSPTESEEERTILTHIINGGERIAEIVHKLIFYGQKEQGGGEYLSLATVLNDAIMLIKHHLKTEGIHLTQELSTQSPAVPVHAQIMQQVLINIFNHRRHALNQKYSIQATDKRLTITSDNFTKAGQRFFQINFTDQGEDLTSEEVHRFNSHNQFHHEPRRALKELIQCRELIEGQGGNLLLAHNPDNESLAIQIRFPLKG